MEKKENVAIPIKGMETARAIMGTMKGAGEPRFKSLGAYISHAIMEQASRDWPSVKARLSLVHKALPQEPGMDHAPVQSEDRDSQAVASDESSQSNYPPTNPFV